MLNCMSVLLAGWHR